MQHKQVIRKSIRAGALFGLIWTPFMILYVWLVTGSLDAQQVGIWMAGGAAAGLLFGFTTHAIAFRKLKSGQGSELMTEQARVLSVEGAPQAVFQRLLEFVQGQADWTVQDVNTDFLTLTAVRTSMVPAKRSRVTTIIKPDGTGSSVRLTSALTLPTAQFDSGQNLANLDEMSDLLLDAFGVEPILRRQARHSLESEAPRPTAPRERT